MNQNNSRLKTPEQNQLSSKVQSKETIIQGRDSLNTSHDYSSINKSTINSNISTSKDKNILREHNLSVKQPKVHSGPFNTKCIFMENAKILL